MADPDHLARLKQGVVEWNRWRAATNHAVADLSGADLAGARLRDADLLRVNLAGANLTRAQLENAHLKEGSLTGAILTGANFEHVNARDANFDDVAAEGAKFEVATLRGATFRRARLAGARFHRAYLRDTDFSGADLTNAWLRFATLEGARCEGADFSGADLRNASLVDTNLKGANLTDVHVFGVSAWNVETDEATRQDLIVALRSGPGAAPLRAHELHTAQLLALMLDGDGVRRVINSVGSRLVLILGSFAPPEKAILDGLREGLQRRGYVAVTFDFVRPTDLDYLETVVTLAGMALFVIADFTNAKEVRAEVAQTRAQFRRVPIIPIALQGTQLPVTLANYFSAEEILSLPRYRDLDDLLAMLDASIIAPAEALVARVAKQLATAEAMLRDDAAAKTES